MRQVSGYPDHTSKRMLFVCPTTAPPMLSMPLPTGLIACIRAAGVLARSFSETAVGSTINHFHFRVSKLANQTIPLKSEPVNHTSRLPEMFLHVATGRLLSLLERPVSSISTPG